MRMRCTNSNIPSWKDYGARGVSVCSEWDQAYEPFRDWALANGYADHLTIDRINNDGNYEPGNCRWATRKTQRYNSKGPAKLTVEQVRAIRADPRMHKDIAPDYGVSRPAVTLIKTRKTWAHIT
jgi:hypothetical protein